MTTLTTTQHSALGELRRRGVLIPSHRAFADDNTRTFSQRTLDALVREGYARYELVFGAPNAAAVSFGIVPADGPNPYPAEAHVLTGGDACPPSVT
jgi:hypothetical protein